MSALILATAPRDDHDTGPNHPERAQRVAAALRGISDAGLDEAMVAVAVREASIDELSRVHTPDYLTTLEAFCDGGGGHLDADTIAGPGSWRAALLTAGAGLSALDALRAEQGDVAFVAGRPPGHHAGAQRAMGFCLVNNVAVAATALAAAGERVVIVDWDVHHGNGTQDIFWNDARVLFISTHQSPLYPGTGAAEETGGPDAPGLTVNIPLPAGATGDVVLRAMDEVAAPAVERFVPDWVLVSAGFDAHRADPLAQMRLSAGDFAGLARRVAAFAPRPGRLALFLEGGYDLEAVRVSVGSTLAAVLGADFCPERPTSGGPGMDAVGAAVRARTESAALPGPTGRI